MDAHDILALWESGATTRSWHARLRDYQRGKQTIPELLKRRIDGRMKSIVKTNWVRYVQRMHTGFLTSLAPNYTVPGVADNPAIQELRRIYEANRLDALDSAHFGSAMLLGRSVEVHSFDGSQIRIARTHPENWVLVEDDHGRVVGGLYRSVLPPWTMYKGELLRAEKVLYTWYDDQSVQVFEEVKAPGGRKTEALPVSEPVAHSYGRVPLAVFRVDEDGESFFSEAFLVQCDIYDVTRSSLTDDIKHNVDSLLKLKGVKMEPLLEKDKEGRSVLEKLREMGIMPLAADADADYLTRNVDIEKFRFDMKVTRASIHLMGCVPDLDEAVGFGNEGTIQSISGIALKLMFQSMIQQSAEFEKQFKGGLRDRVELINRVQAIRSRPVLEGYEVAMTRNIPANEIEFMQYIANLKGIVGRKDMLRILPQIQDVERSYKELLDEAKGADASNTAIFGYHIDGGVVTINDVRQRLGLPAVEWGDEIAPSAKAKLPPGEPAGEES